MIKRRSPVDQRLDDPVVPQVRCRDKCGAIILAGDCLCIPAELDCKLHHAYIVSDGRDCDDVIAVILQGVDVAAASDESTYRIVVRSKAAT